MKEFMRYAHPSQFINVGYQLIFLIITITAITLLTIKPVIEFHPVGPEPIIESIDTFPATEKVIRVKTGMHIADFLKFDPVKNEFIINAFIWFDYDKKRVSQEIIDAFAFTKGELLQKSTPIITEHNGLTRALYTIRVQFSTILDFSRFPLDDHRIFLNLTNTKTAAHSLLYTASPDDFIVSKNIYLSGWNVMNHGVSSGYADIELGKNDVMPQTKTVFSIDLSKGDIRQLILIFLPLLFLFYLGLFAFSIKDTNIAMTLPLASISGLFAYSFVIQILAPMVGYMMLSDHLFLFFLFSAFVIFLVKALAVVPETHLSRHSLRIIEGLTVIILQLALVVIWFVLVDVRCV